MRSERAIIHFPLKKNYGVKNIKNSDKRGKIRAKTVLKSDIPSQKSVNFSAKIAKKGKILPLRPNNCT